MSSAADGLQVAREMVTVAMDHGMVERGLHQARQQGIRGQLVVHLLSYSDQAGSMIIDVLQQEGVISAATVAGDKAYQQAEAMPGFLACVLEATESADLVSGLAEGGSRSGVLEAIRMADELGRVPVVVIAAGRVMGCMVDLCCTCKRCAAARPQRGAGDAERERRKQRARRADR